MLSLRLRRQFNGPSYYLIISLKMDTNRGFLLLSVWIFLAHPVYNTNQKMGGHENPSNTIIFHLVWIFLNISCNFEQILNTNNKIIKHQMKKIATSKKVNMTCFFLYMMINLRNYLKFGIFVLLTQKFKRVWGQLFSFEQN